MGISENEPRALPERLLSAAEVADWLGIPLNTLYRWRCERTGPAAVRVGKHIRFRRGVVDAWLDDQTDAAA